MKSYIMLSSNCFEMQRIKSSLYNLSILIAMFVISSCNKVRKESFMDSKPDDITLLGVVKKLVHSESECEKFEKLSRKNFECETFKKYKNEKFEELVRKKSEPKVVTESESAEEYKEFFCREADIKSKIDMKSIFDYTALIYAASFGKIAIVKILLEKGADVNLQDACGYTALMWAVENNHTETAELLLKQDKVDIDIKDEDENTVLMIAARKKNIKIVTLLLNKGTDIDHENKNGDTALILAAYYGNTDIVKLLLENGAEINHKNNKDDTALILAAEEGQTEI